MCIDDLFSVLAPSILASFLPSPDETEVMLLILTIATSILTLFTFFAGLPGAFVSWRGITIQDWWREKKRKIRARAPHTFFENDFFELDTKVEEGNFNQWRFYDPLNDCSMTPVAGTGVRIYVPTFRHDLWPVSNFNAPRLMRRTTGDSIVTAGIRFNFEERIQAGGLLAWKDAGEYWRLNYMKWWDGCHYIVLEGCHNGAYSTISSKRIEAQELFLRFDYSHTRGRISASYRRPGRKETLSRNSDAKARWRGLDYAEFTPSGPFDVGIFVMNEHTESAPCYMDTLLFTLDIG